MKRNRVLLVDDSLPILAEYESLLRGSREFEIVGKCTDGMQGLKAISELNPDVVILDIVMPRMDGIELLNSLRLSGAFMPKIIVISAIGREDIIDKALSLGAVYYIMKPFENANILRRIRQAAGIIPMSGSELTVKPEKDTRGPEEKLPEAVTNILHEIGVPANIKGYQYLRDAIIISVEDRDILNSVTKALYPTVALMNNTSATKVERAIRHAIEVAFFRGNQGMQDELFAYTTKNSRGKATNSEFIALVSEKIRMELKEKDS